MDKDVGKKRNSSDKTISWEEIAGWGGEIKHQNYDTFSSIAATGEYKQALSGASALSFTGYFKSQKDAKKPPVAEEIETWSGSADQADEDEDDFQTAIPVKNLMSDYNADALDKPTLVEIDDEMPIWEWQFSMFNLTNMMLKEVSLVNLEANKLNELHRNFKRARRDFLRYIAYYNVPDLEVLGMDDKAMRTLKKAKAPENFDVHLKVPFEYGGTCDFSNLLFVRSHPFHDDIHKFIDMQINSHPLGSKLSKLYVPDFDGRVYLPEESSALGGGKGKGDKTSVQGYSASTLQALASRIMDRGAKL